MKRLSKDTLQIRSSIERVCPAPEDSIEQDRKEWEEFALTIPLPDNLIINTKIINGIKTEIIYTSNCNINLPIIHFHGGGFEAGSCITHRELASKLVLATQRPVILPEYSLAPEHPFPAGLDDCVAVYKGVLNMLSTGGNIILCGDSAGGGMVMSTLLSLKKQGVVLPEAAVLMSPFCDMTITGDSYQTRKKIEPQLCMEGLQRSADRYLNKTDPANPILSPKYADLSELPPLFIQTGDDEILLSDSTTLAKRAKEWEVETTLEVWDNMWHVFQAYPIEEATKALFNIAQFISQFQ